MINWLMSLPWYWRAGAALVCLMISTGMLMAGRIWPWGWVVGVLLLLLLPLGSTESEDGR
jgi:hypothetical protein